MRTGAPTNRIDQRHMLRVAVERAATEIIDSFWDGDRDRIARLFHNLGDGSLTIQWDLKYPEDVEAVAEEQGRREAA